MSTMKLFRDRADAAEEKRQQDSRGKMQYYYYSRSESSALAKIDASEVLRIKKLLDHNQHQHSEELLFNSLRHLLSMEIPAEALMATNILTSVRCMRGNPSRLIRNLVNVLIRGWKTTLDEWMDGTAINPESAGEDPQPALDGELAWHEERTDLPHPGIGASLDVSFDGMEEEGNSVSQHVENPEIKKTKLQRNVGRGKVLEVCLEAAVDATDQGRLEKTQKLESEGAKEKQPRKIQTSVAEQAKVKQLRSAQPSEAKNAGGKQPRDTDQTLKSEIAVEKQQRKARTLADAEAKEKQHRMTETLEQQRKLTQTFSATSHLMPTVAEKKSVEVTYYEKLEASKKRLHEGYADAYNAKRMRRIKILELKHISVQRSRGKRGCRVKK